MTPYKGEYGMGKPVIDITTLKNDREICHMRGCNLVEYKVQCGTLSLTL